MPKVSPKLNPKTRQSEGFDSMLRRFKRACDKAEIVQEVRQRQYHEKPNDTKNQKNQDLKRRKKLDAKRKAQSNYRKIRRVIGMVVKVPRDGTQTRKPMLIIGRKSLVRKNQR